MRACMLVDDSVGSQLWNNFSSNVEVVIPALSTEETTPSVETPETPRTSPYFRWKGIVSRLFALALLVPATPIILVTMLAVRLTSAGPAIYRQRRTGKDGRVFTMYKIRSMHVNAENGSGPVWAKDDDPRTTWLGKILRKTHLDELPQLVNVVRGEMDLVGPRPERPEFVKRLAHEVPGYLDRLTVLPGITGLAQVNLPPDQDVSCVRRKVLLDRRYIENASLLLDLRLLFATCLKLKVNA